MERHVQQSNHIFPLVTCLQRWRIFALCLALFVCFGEQIEADIVRDVRVEGSERVGSQEVQSWLVTRVGARLDSTLLKQDIRRILKGYKELGFWRVEVTFPKIFLQRGHATIVFAVKEGMRTRIDSVKITGDLAFGENDVRAALGIGRGMVLIEGELGQRFEHLLRFYENRGYPFCELRPEVRFNTDGVKVMVDVSTGPFVQVDTVRFEGNEVTRSDILLKHISFVAGEPYDQRRVDRYVKEIKRLSFIDDAYNAELLFTEDEKGLVITVAEARHTRIEGGVGLGSGAGGSGQVLTGAVTVDLLNFAGKGRQGQAHWARQEAGVADLRVFYREPWLFNSPISGWATVEMDERLGYVAHKIGGGMDVSVGGGIQLVGGISQKKVLPDSTGFDFYNPENIWSFEAGIKIDRRDDRWNPLRGWRSEIVGELGEVASGITRRKWTIDGEMFWPIGKRSTVAGRVRAEGVSQTDSVPETALLRVGGVQSLRGYQEEAFWGTKASWVNVEWRWLLGPRARLFAFVDAGSIWGNGSKVWPVAYGVGLLANGRMGAVGVDYGLPRGESLGHGMVHVRMIGEF